MKKCGKGEQVRVAGRKSAAGLLVIHVTLAGLQHGADGFVQMGQHGIEKVIPVLKADGIQRAGQAMHPVLISGRQGLGAQVDPIEGEYLGATAVEACVADVLPAQGHRPPQGRVQGDGLLVQGDPSQHLVAFQPFDEQNEQEYRWAKDEERPALRGEIRDYSGGGEEEGAEGQQGDHVGVDEIALLFHLLFL